MTKYQEEMTDYLNTVVSALSKQGVTQAVISPGSRSTPLALLLHRHELIETTVCVDERSAAFFALGKSLALKEPVVLLCTSGTAAANYYPAICEAFESHIPLIVLTTDRPHELRQLSAPQTMDQQSLYGSHVKAFLDFSLPDNSPELLQYAFWQTSRLTNLAKQHPTGPVQLNFPLREPLLPDLLRKTPSQTSFSSVMSGSNSLSDEQFTKLKEMFSGKNVLVVVGGAHTPKQAQTLLKITKSIGWPVIGDPLVNALGCGFKSELYISHADLILPFLKEDVVPDLILRIGQLPISKETMLYLKKINKPTVWLDEAGGFSDMLKQSDLIIQTSFNQFLSGLEKLDITPSHVNWTESWSNAQLKVSELCHKKWEHERLSEDGVSKLVVEHMASRGQLFLSNSLSIRHVDRFASQTTQEFQVFGNRGVNGIDGIISSAIGMASCDKTAHSVLLTGDLTLYHDMNGLLLAKENNIPLTIVLLNNRGGGIFSYLSQNQLDKSDFEPLFGTPLDINFEDVAKLYGASYHLVTNEAEFLERFSQHDFQIIEVQTNRDDNVTKFNQIKEKIKEMLQYDD